MLYSCKLKIKPQCKILCQGLCGQGVGEGGGVESPVEELAAGHPAGQMGELPHHGRGTSEERPVVGWELAEPKREPGSNDGSRG